MANDLARLTSIVQEIDKETKIHEEKRETEKKLEETREKKIRTGKSFLEEPVPRVLLTNELPNNLRSLKVSTAGDLLQERLVQFQKRKMVEVVNENPRENRKRRVKIVNKPNMRMDEEKTLGITL